MRKIFLRMMISYLLVFPVSSLLYASDYYEDPMVGLSSRLTGMGGLHAAYADGFTTIYTNPAGFFESGEEVSWGEITLGLKGPIFSIADAIIGGDTDLTSIGDLLTGIYAGLGLSGPLSFGYVGNGLGLGIIGTSDVLLSSYTPLAATARVRQDLLLVGGYSFPINIMPEGHRLDGGVLLKGGFRGELEAEVTAVDIQDFDPSQFTDDEPFAFINLIGMDLGLLYSWQDRLFVGLTGKDVYTPTSKKNYASLQAFLDGDAELSQEYGVVPFTLNIGTRYLLDLSEKNLFISTVNFYLDYADLLDFWLYPTLAVNPVLHVSLGAELTMLRILAVRLGFSEGLPAAGIGVNLKWFTLNASMFGTERSTEPGMSPVYNLQLGFEFRY
ncbi:hypothetical protein [Sediminispirochaeta bajacaliforniensis]|uniref:hypothetical protein n=1 Tax=Sediminispirochaeta bajacaliforniensis TaxID=148 RepID=UPI000368D4B8|nr:hypothetical protein [Sediminispirochaeta bajacaliforniensis]